MRRLSRKSRYLLLLGIITILAAVIMLKYLDMTVNNRFVSFAIILFIDIFFIILLLFKKATLNRNLLLGIVAMAAFAFA